MKLNIQILRLNVRTWVRVGIVTGVILLFNNCSSGFKAVGSIDSSSSASTGVTVTSCSLNGVSYAIGQTISGYPADSATSPNSCGAQPITRTCLSSGQFNGATPLYSTCSQFCINPDTTQQVTSFSYYTVSSAASQQACQNAYFTVDCDPATGQFAAQIPTAGQRYAVCSVNGVTAPVIASFTANPTTITQGQSTTLSWAVTGTAVNLSISPTVGAVTGMTSVTVQPTTNTTYTLTASNGTATVTKTVLVTVNTVIVTPPPSGSPDILYTDIVSGPNTGGENNNGIYLSIFGKNLGSNCTGVAACASQVTIGGGKVAQVMYIGPSNGRSDIEQLSVQIGSLAKTGAIVVTTPAGTSNTDQTFTVTSGHIYFVDNASALGGSSPITPSVATTLPSQSNAGTITAPFRYIQNGEGGKDASSVVVPGDFMVARGYSGQWAEAMGGEGNGSSKSALWGIGSNVSAKANAGTAGMPITLMGYPGEFPYFNLGGTISGGVGTPAGEGGIYPWGNVNPSYINIVDIHIEAGGNNGAISCDNSPVFGNYWRVVNNNVTMMSATSKTEAGAFDGSCQGQYWVGNHVHDTAGGSGDQTHGMYVGANGTFEISYNWIENINNGTGIQLYADDPDATGVVQAISNVRLDHNIIHNTAKYGINIAGDGEGTTYSGSMTNIVVWDNLVYNTGLSGLIFNYIDSANPLVGALIYNNTFYNVCTSSSCTSGDYGAIDDDNGSVLTSGSATLMNNIFVPAKGVKYYTEKASGLTSLPASNNLWYGGTGSVLGASNVTTNPDFATTPAATVASGQAIPDMSLVSGSPAYNAGSANVKIGNGAAASTYLPAFTGVTNDLLADPIEIGNPDIGCYQH